MAWATVAMTPGSYHRCGFGVLSGRPSSFCTTMTRRPESGDRLLDAVHERVVAQAVLHPGPGRVDQAADRGARLERVRVRAGVAHDAADLDVFPADLLDDV